VTPRDVHVQQHLKKFLCSSSGRKAKQQNFPNTVTYLAKYSAEMPQNIIAYAAFPCEG
jgi:hypothetical protein